MSALIKERTEFQKTLLQELKERHNYRIRICAQSYDANYAMDRELLIEFLDATQPDEMAALRKRYGDRTEQQIVDAVNAAAGNPDRGLIDVLKNGIQLDTVTLQVMIKRPASQRNTKLVEKYSKNIFSVMEEVVISKSERVDVVIFLNGLAIISFELKSNYAGQNSKNAAVQFIQQRDPENRLFRFKQGCFVNFAMDLFDVRMCTRLAKEKTFFLPFNKGNGDGVEAGAGNPLIPGKFSVCYMWEEVLQPDMVIELITHFLLLERNEGKDDVLIFPRYHQLQAVRNVINDVREKRDDLPNYLIQHSAGSGKTYSIAWLAYRLASLHDSNDKAVFDQILIITDRVVVDRQLQAAINKLEHKAGFIEVMDEKKKSSDLAAALNSNVRVIGSTIQKFSYILDIMKNQRDKRFAVIIDEAHSSTSGRSMAAVTASLSTADSSDPDDDLETFAKDMENQGNQPNIALIAFTATPKPTTLHIFGTKTDKGTSAFHVYSMKQAVEEGFILDVLKNYLEYQTYWTVTKTDESDPKLQTAEAKRQISAMINNNAENIAQRAKVIGDHFFGKVEQSPQKYPNQKAMIVTASREEAVRYKQAIDTYMQENNLPYKSLVAFSGSLTIENEVDGRKVPVDLTEVSMNDGLAEKDLPKKFDEDDYKFLVVADKYQTGFDQPKLCAMYLTKKIKSVTAVQTLSRLNRMHRGKKDTFVLDFANTQEEMIQSFAPFYTATNLVNDPDPAKLKNMADAIYGLYVLSPLGVDSANKALDQSAFKTLGKLEDHLKKEVDMRVQQAFYEFDKKDLAVKKDFIAKARGFLRLYDFLCLVTSLPDRNLFELYRFLRLLTPMLKMEKAEAVEVDLTGLVEVGDFKQIAGEEKKTVDQVSNPNVELAQAAASAKEPAPLELLSHILTGINAANGNKLNVPKLAEHLNQMNDAMKDAPELRESAQHNTLQEFDGPYLKFGRQYLMRNLWRSGDEELRDGANLLLDKNDNYRNFWQVFGGQLMSQVYNHHRQQF